jgi:hypothetical protein
MKIVGRFFKQLGDADVDATSVQNSLYHASTRTIAWVDDRNRINYVQDGTEAVLEPSYGTVCFIHVMERLDAVLTIEQSSDKVSQRNHLRSSDPCRNKCWCSRTSS